MPRISTAGTSIESLPALAIISRATWAAVRRSHVVFGGLRRERYRVPSGRAVSVIQSEASQMRVPYRAGTDCGLDISICSSTALH